MACAGATRDAAKLSSPSPRKAKTGRYSEHEWRPVRGLTVNMPVDRRPTKLGMVRRFLRISTEDRNLSPLQSRLASADRSCRGDDYGLTAWGASCPGIWGGPGGDCWVRTVPSIAMSE
jgi:hypothetical protein